MILFLSLYWPPSRDALHPNDQTMLARILPPLVAYQAVGHNQDVTSLWLFSIHSSSLLILIRSLLPNFVLNSEVMMGKSQPKTSLFFFTRRWGSQYDKAEVFLVWIYHKFRPPQEPQWPITSTDLIINCRHHFNRRLKRKQEFYFLSMCAHVDWNWPIS